MSEMDIEEQLVGLCNNNNDVAKGKRTKRLRPLSPCAVAATAVTSSCSSANSEEHVSACGESGSFSSTTTIFKSTTNQEEEDMAKCLILLAQGKGGEDDVGGNKNKNTESISTTTMTTTATATATTTKKIGFYTYECKTCNKTFQSFQALGGHRASHKRPKVNLEEKETPPPPSSSPPPITNFEFEESKETLIKSSRQVPITLQLGCGNNRGFHGNKTKIHECSICGSEFTSGQALGGHMRRHRASTNTSDGAATAAMAEVKPRNVLELDLNLPAPEEDVRDSKFQFSATQKSMVLSPVPALVGCHY